MELEQAIHVRRAVREYTAEPLGDEIIRKLIDAAVNAPSAVNEQPWQFCVIRDRALLATISREAKAYMLRTTPATLLSHHFQEGLSDPAFDIFHGAPALILISSATRTAWATEDCALAAENLMLAAADMGLGTCWIGFAQTWLRTEEGKAMLGLPQEYTPVAPIIVGHPKTAVPPVPRRDAKITWIGQ